MRTRTTTKAEVEHLLKASRADDYAAHARATTAYRVYVAQLSDGRDAELTPEADAGGQLEAETARAACRLRELYEKIHTK